MDIFDNLFQEALEKAEASPEHPLAARLKQAALFFQHHKDALLTFACRKARAQGLERDVADGVGTSAFIDAFYWIVEAEHYADFNLSFIKSAIKNKMMDAYPDLFPRKRDRKECSDETIYADMRKSHQHQLSFEIDEESGAQKTLMRDGNRWMVMDNDAWIDPLSDPRGNINHPDMKNIMQHARDTVAYELLQDIFALPDVAKALAKPGYIDALMMIYGEGKSYDEYAKITENPIPERTVRRLIARIKEAALSNTSLLKRARALEQDAIEWMEQDLSIYSNLAEI